MLWRFYILLFLSSKICFLCFGGWFSWLTLNRKLCFLGGSSGCSPDILSLAELLWVYPVHACLRVGHMWLDWIWISFLAFNLLEVSMYACPASLSVWARKTTFWLYCRFLDCRCTQCRDGTWPQNKNFSDRCLYCSLTSWLQVNVNFRVCICLLFLFVVTFLVCLGFIVVSYKRGIYQLGSLSYLSGSLGFSFEVILKADWVMLLLLYSLYIYNKRRLQVICDIIDTSTE